MRKEQKSDEVYKDTKPDIVHFRDNTLTCVFDA